VTKIDVGISTVGGIEITVITDVGNDGKSVTGTKITVDGTQTVGKYDGVETITECGMMTVDGIYVTWIGTNVDGSGGGGTNVAIDVGTSTVDGIVKTVKTDVGNDGNSVTGTKITVDGTQAVG
jgi:hypothetical protein